MDLILGERDDAKDVEDFGQKFLGVKEGGTIEIHGEDRLTWTKITQTVGPTPRISTNLNDQPGNWGVIVYELSPVDGSILNEMQTAGKQISKNNIDGVIT